jgi:hypothetical protein
LARPTCPPLRHTRIISEAARSWSTANIAPNEDKDGVEALVGEWQALRIALHEADAKAFCLGALAIALREIGGLIGGGDVAPAAYRGERCREISCGHVENPLLLA